MVVVAYNHGRDNRSIAHSNNQKITWAQKMEQQR